MTTNFNREAYEKVFNDLEEFRNFCAYSYLQGFPGYVFDEKDLYNNDSYVWRAFQNRHKGPPPAKPFKRNNKPFRRSGKYIN